MSAPSQKPFAAGEVLRAAAFAAGKHRDQRRKDAAAAPYINHPLAVANLLIQVGEVRETAVIVAALLHDTVEDTATTPDELEAHFGAGVRALVMEVTDDKSLPKAERKARQVAHAPHLSRGAKVIKLADKSCNVQDLIQNPPHWPLERRLAYIDWAEAVVAGVRGANPALEAHFDAVIAAARAALAGTDAYAGT